VLECLSSKCEALEFKPSAANNNNNNNNNNNKIT
jgi:hypothetical protein